MHGVRNFFKLYHGTSICNFRLKVYFAYRPGFLSMFEDRQIASCLQRKMSSISEFFRMFKDSLCTVDDLGQIFDLLSAWKLKSKNAPRDLKFNHNVAI